MPMLEAAYLIGRIDGRRNCLFERSPFSARFQLMFCHFEDCLLPAATTRCGTVTAFPDALFQPVQVKKTMSLIRWSRSSVSALFAGRLHLFIACRPSSDCIQACYRQPWIRSSRTIVSSIAARFSTCVALSAAKSSSPVLCIIHRELSRHLHEARKSLQLEKATPSPI